MADHSQLDKTIPTAFAMNTSTLSTSRNTFDCDRLYLWPVRIPEMFDMIRIGARSRAL